MSLRLGVNDSIFSGNEQQKVWSRYFSYVIEILLFLTYSGMVLTVVCWRYGIPFDANGSVSTVTNVD